MNKKMDAKKVLVSFLAIASILLLAASASAADVTTNANIKVDDVTVATYNGSVILGDVASVIAGDTVTVRVEFTAVADFDLVTPEIQDSISNVRLRAEIEGNEGDVTAVTPYFDVEAGKTYVKTLTIKVPSVDNKDNVKEAMTLNLKLWNAGSETKVESLNLNVQREAYTVDVVSVNVDSSLNAGEVFPVEVMLKNTGYNDLEDVYVTVKIDALGIAKTAYFGDIVSVNHVDKNNDDVDTVSGKVYLTLPFDVKEGKYTLEVVVKNSDTTVTETEEVFIANSFPEEVIKVANGLFLINPSTELRMYKVVTPSDETIVSVQAGTSKTVDVKATSAGYTVTVTRMNGEVVGTFSFDASSSGQLIVNGSPVVVLTAILAVVFLILVVVLVVLMTKKPKKSEESESYY